MLMTQDR